MPVVVSLWFLCLAVTCVVFVLSFWILSSLSPHKGGHPLAMVPPAFVSFLLSVFAGGGLAYWLVTLIP